MMINWLRKIIFLTQSHLGDKYQKLNPNTDLSTKELFALRHYIIVVQYFVFLKNLTLMRTVTFYLFYFFREKRRERGREGENINVWVPLTHPLLGTWSSTQACALTGNWTADPLVHRPELSLLSYISQGEGSLFKITSVQGSI